MTGLSLKKTVIQKLKIRITSLVLLLLAFVGLSSHDLFLKMETYFLQPQQEATFSLYNGTFEKSENIITRDRMLDASVIANGNRMSIESSQWKDQDSTVTLLPFTAGDAGTYVVGVSTKGRNIELEAEKFNSYLEHDGVLDMLAYRKENNLLNVDAVENYQKHVKAIYQVGETKTADWSTHMGYPIEFVPLENPYEKYTGDDLEVQLLLDGEPLTNQLVYAQNVENAHVHTHDESDHHHSSDGHNHSHSETEPHTHTSGQQLRTNSDGVVKVQLPKDGIYYLRTIHMQNVDDDSKITHLSKWATLTFEVTHDHGSHTHTNDGVGIPAWLWALVSLALIGVLFLVFKK